MKNFKLEHWYKVFFFLVFYDAITITVSYLAALWLRYDCAYSRIPAEQISAFQHFIPIYVVACIVVYYAARLYHSIWRFASHDELTRAAAASLTMAAMHALLISTIFERMPMSYYVWGGLFQFCCAVFIRFSYRFVLLQRKSLRSNKSTRERVMLIGAGSAGQMILRDINRSDSINDEVVCIIDDNPNKWNRFIEGVPIVGGRETILLNVEKYRVDKIYYAIPSASPAERKEILGICSETSCELKQLPGMYQFVTGKITASALKDVAIEDLLGRDAIKTDMQEVFAFITGKVILVTGGGGSIGSELCRQIAAHSPKTLIIFDIYENNAYNIQLELRDKYPDLDLVTLIGSVRDSRRLDQIFRTYRPQIVYHAAAHKHVPLMEDSPCESIKNNAVGTYKTAYEAMKYGCDKFVLISTDKAVNPTNIMGASKRLCEMIIQSFNEMVSQGKHNEIPRIFTHDCNETEVQPLNTSLRTDFVAVRFGNVLGSNGSVIPIFRRQIEKGGPVTVTHPDIIRYFMTIPEAVSLVMLAGTYAKGGEIFVLDMGSPMKIDTLARNLIRLSGLVPDVDIAIEYTGLRPGEKLFEEKLMAEEGMKTTPNKLIHIGCPIPFNTEDFLQQIEPLMEAAYSNTDNIKEMVASIVTTYKPE